MRDKTSLKRCSMNALCFKSDRTSDEPPAHRISCKASSVHTTCGIPFLKGSASRESGNGSTSDRALLSTAIILTFGVILSLQAIETLSRSHRWPLGNHWLVHSSASTEMLTVRKLLTAETRAQRSSK